LEHFLLELKAKHAFILATFKKNLMFIVFLHKLYVMVTIVFIDTWVEGWVEHIKLLL